MEDKVFLKEGDTCIVRQDVDNKPLMVVEKLERSKETQDGVVSKLLRVRCYWFDANMVLQKYGFNCKDLKKA